MGDRQSVMISDDIRARREKLVLDHFHDEVAHQWDDVLSTFPHPRYEIIPTQTVYDGDVAVRAYYIETRTAFPDQRHQMIALRHSDDAVIAEFYLLGTHLGPFGPVPPTGAKFKVRMSAFFVFRGDDELVAERIYFDQFSLVRQLLSAVDVKSPKGIVLLLKALGGFAKLARQPKDPIPDGMEYTVAAPEICRD
jgi:predicted ester cyclase